MSNPVFANAGLVFKTLEIVGFSQMGLQNMKPVSQSEDQTDMEARLEKLSAKEREVLDQILLHKSLKVIANDLSISISAVDQRLKSARGKLGAADRNSAARAYSALLAACRNSTCGFEAVASSLDRQLSGAPEPSRSRFTLADSAMIEVPGLGDDQDLGSFSEILDEKFGKLWRVAAIPVFAVALAMLALALIAMSTSLGELL